MVATIHYIREMSQSYHVWFVSSVHMNQYRSRGYEISRPAMSISTREIPSPRDIYMAGGISDRKESLYSPAHIDALSI